MAYLGRKGAVAPLTSADIPVGIVEGTDIAFLENASGTQNLGGTYSTERMYLNDSYTLTGDVTITGHLALGTVADSDVVITDDGSTRTITGSGTLETGELMPKRRETLTGMTGELGTGVTLGSAVTGSPNLNLGNATFPQQRKIGRIERAFDAASGTQQVTGIGFQPVYIEFTGAVDDQLSVFHGWADLVNEDQHWVGNRPSASDDWKVDQTVDLSLYLVGDGSANNCQQGKVTATDSDSFTITWTKFNSPGSLTMRIIYRAYRY